MLLPLPPLLSLPTYQSPTSGSFRGRILRHNSSRQAILEQTQYFLLTYAQLGLAETFRSVSVLRRKAEQLFTSTPLLRCCFSRQSQVTFGPRLGSLTGTK